MLEITILKARMEGIQRSDPPMVTNMLYGGPFRDMRLLQEEINRLAQRAAAPRASFPAINIYAHHGGTARRAKRRP